MKKPLIHIFLSVWLFISPFVNAQKDSLSQLQDRKYSLHFQTTIIPQYHYNFKAAYSGDNSLLTSEPASVSFSGTAFFSYKPFPHTYLVLNTEAAGGKGLSKTLGIAGFPNGEVYRVGDPKPKPFIARLYAEQRFPLTMRMEKVEDDINQVAEATNADYLSVLIGKFSLIDFFDISQISHDPRTQFLNWSLMGNGAWDYPANTRGYTIGAVVQVYYHDWAFRTAITTVPIEANGPELQFKFGQAMGMVWEIGKAHLFQRNETHFSSLHAGFFWNKARMGNYLESVQKAMMGFTIPDITDSRKYGRDKWGYYIGLDNHFGQVHHFIKTSWNDGNNETWAFTEIDKSVTTGLQLDGEIWKRKKDRLALAFVSNGLSTAHKNYLAQGGYGFLIGDGKLNYGNEQILEVYYSLNLYKQLFISPDYQFITNPAYNKDRGPVHIIALRIHMEF